MDSPYAVDIPNPAIAEFVEEWAAITQPANIELVSAADNQRLIDESLEDGSLQPAGRGRYFSRSHAKDTARSEERTVVATSRPEDKGVYNNWRDGEETVETLRQRMKGASAGKTMYVVPYLMAVPGNPLAPYAAGVELTDDRNVVLQMMRMARVGIEYLNGLEDPNFFVRGVHVTGDLDNLGQGTDDDQRLFATVADQRMILHYGSAYGGNALLGKIAHALRQAAYDGWRSEKFLAEQFMLLGIHDKETGRTYRICGGFPSASGKTNLAMTLPPDALGDRYRVDFYGDDIAWLWVGEDGRLYGMNPEDGVFGVAKDTNEETNPAALHAIAEGSGAIFTNVAYNPSTHEVWWEGKTPEPPTDEGWIAWNGEEITADFDGTWTHPNGRFTVDLEQVTTVAPDAFEPAGVPIDAVIFGGRASDREPLIRAITDVAEGVYDGLTLGAEATFAAEGMDGKLRYDPMSMRPFMSYPEGDYAQHWLNVFEKVEDKPIFAHVNWFQRDPEDGHYLWPGYRDNLRALLWLIDYREGRAEGVNTPVGMLPKKSELNLEGVDISEEDLDAVLRIDEDRWRQEMEHRSEHLAQFDNLPQEIWDAHERMKKALEED
ncbi:phosphoenolpyruvate carboxykinase (GTP) [Corynebacterium cystitidis]|uniref:phosphoenolpyruvate carboxykinase (GTP) n=1 Tax=Corynebacterium cystitidis TaxID=35757 RepID=UPI00211E5F3D|nr:phosphoenolpyruvate carboxykinase (GTP) [Corynebacterium cystitidis]